MDRPMFYINGQPIPRSFWGRVVNVCHGDKAKANLVFYRAHIAKPVDVIKWVQAGLAGAMPYAFRPCKAEERGQTEALAWIEENIIGKRKAKPVQQINLLVALEVKAARDALNNQLKEMGL